MFDADHLGWEAFCEKVLFHLAEDAGEVGLIMTNNPDSITIELHFDRHHVRGGKYEFSIEKSLIKTPEFRANPRIAILKTLEKNGHTPLIMALKEAETRKSPELRYPTWKPKAYLCKNSGQYHPWWSHPDYQWNRCFDKDSNHSPGDEGIYACQCDEGCLARKDCCTDFVHSCKEETEPWDQEECPTTDGECPTGDPVTLLISMDGFRYSYIAERSDMIPNIMHMRECGLKTHMQCSYPSKTFPNHYTLVTGLHPSQHGIVDNDWFDWKRNASCSVFNDNSDRDYPCAPMKQDEGWYGGDPVWNTVERHGKISAACLWPGCELEINGERATYFWDYDDHGEGPFAERVYQVLDWLQRPKWDGNQSGLGFSETFKLKL